MLKIAITGNIGAGGDFLKSCNIYIEIYKYDDKNIHTIRPNN